MFIVPREAILSAAIMETLRAVRAPLQTSLGSFWRSARPLTGWEGGTQGACCPSRRTSLFAIIASELNNFSFSNVWVKLHVPWFCSFRLWRFINHLLTYLHTYLLTCVMCVQDYQCTDSVSHVGWIIHIESKKVKEKWWAHAPHIRAFSL